MDIHEDVVNHLVKVYENPEQFFGKGGVIDKLRATLAERLIGVRNEPRYPAHGPPAIRLVFAYENESITLVRKENVEASVSESDPIYGYTGEQGSWVEVLDKQDRCIFRRLLSNPIQSDVEGPSDEPGHPLTMRSTSNLTGVFVVLVPDMKDGQTLTIWNSSIEAVASPAREIARFPLHPNKGAT
jgi:hypothetical protein